MLRQPSISSRNAPFVQLVWLSSSLAYPPQQASHIQYNKLCINLFIKKKKKTGLSYACMSPPKPLF